MIFVVFLVPVKLVYVMRRLSGVEVCRTIVCRLVQVDKNTCGGALSATIGLWGCDSQSVVSI